MRNPALILFLAGCCVLLGACSKRTAASVAGDYEGEYHRGVEKFTLTSDGKFTQEFTSNGTVLYTNQGTWTVSERTVRFQKFMEAYCFTDKHFSEFRKPMDEVEAHIPFGTSAILFNDDGDYFVRKK